MVELPYFRKSCHDLLIAFSGLSLAIIKAPLQYPQKTAATLLRTYDSRQVARFNSLVERHLPLTVSSLEDIQVHIALYEQHHKNLQKGICTTMEKMSQFNLAWLLNGED